jgi:RHS repeat-associated protein
VYLYDAWGNQLAVSGSTVNPFRWIGRVGYCWDEGTGTFYIRARVYDPLMGRWLSQDPLFFPVPSAVQLSDYLNFTGLYQYIAARVLNVTDPSGTLAPNSADNRIDTHGDAQLACAQAWLDRLDRDTTPLPPFSAAVRNKCSMDILNVTLTSERLRQLGTYFDFWENAWKPPRCEFPAICCACCRWAGQYNRSDHAIFVCANNVRTPLEIETVSLHELTHALQSCYPYQASSPCELSIKRKLEAYSCAGQCDRTFCNCLPRALSSSCGSGACTSQDWNQTFFQKIENWYRDNKAGFCTPGGRGQATKRVNIHDCRVLRSKHGL